MSHGKCSIGPPISANQMYAPIVKNGAAKLTKTRKYRQWIEDNRGSVCSNMRVAQNFPVAIKISVVGTIGGMNTGDIDNVIKPCVDLLVSCGIIPDDSRKFVARAESVHWPFPGKASNTITVIEYEELTNDDVWEDA